MKIVWTRLALSDLDEAYNYIASSNPSAAADIIDRIEGAVNTLSLYPNIGRQGRIASTRNWLLPARLLSSLTGFGANKLRF